MRFFFLSRAAEFESAVFGKAFFSNKAASLLFFEVLLREVW